MGNEEGKRLFEMVPDSVDRSPATREEGRVGLLLDTTTP
jgi:hypothetical protein